VTAGLGYGFDSYAVNIYGLVLPDIKKSLHITDAQAGYIGSIFLLGYTIGTIGFGLAADRWGRKTTLGASILLYGTTTALAGLTTNIAAFTGLRFLTGVGGAGELAVGAPYTAEVWPAKTRAIGVGGVIFSLFSLAMFSPQASRWHWCPALAGSRRSSSQLFPPLFCFWFDEASPSRIAMSTHRPQL
jgi:putative MFS transporter